jgi:hypothetical protein
MEWFSNHYRGILHPQRDVTVHIQTNASIALHMWSYMCTATKGYAVRIVSSSTYGCNQSGMHIDQIACVKPEFLICGSGSPQELLHL